MGWTWDAYAQTVSVDCDLNLSPSDIVFTHYTSSCCDDHFCQNIFQILQIFRMKLCVGHDFGLHKLTGTLTFDLATWFLYAPHGPFMVIISAE